MTALTLAILALTFAVLAGAYEINILRKGVHKLMATGDQAVQDLGTLITNLTKAVADAAKALTDVLAKIGSAGADPAAVEALVGTGNTLVQQLTDAAAAAEAAINPAPPAP